ncbi:MAG TPA: pentapeptide repeat-containing protein, partial [Caulobacteraceae bacterium]
MTASALMLAAALASTEAAQAPGEEPTPCEAVSPRDWRNPNPVPPWQGARKVAGPNFDPRRAGDGPLIVQGGDLRRVSFKGVKLSRVCFESSNLAGTDWTGAEVSDSAFVHTDIKGATLAGRFPRTRFVSAALDGAKADAADLSEASFEGGSFGGLSLRRARLRGFKLDCSANLFVHGDHCTDSAPNSEEAAPPAPVDARGADLTEAEFVEWDGAWTLHGAVIDRTRVEIQAAGWLRGAVFRGPIVVTGGSESL